MPGWLGSVTMKSFNDQNPFFLPYRSGWPVKVWPSTTTDESVAASHLHDFTMTIGQQIPGVIKPSGMPLICVFSIFFYLYRSLTYLHWTESVLPPGSMTASPCWRVCGVHKSASTEMINSHAHWLCFQKSCPLAFTLRWAISGPISYKKWNTEKPCPVKGNNPSSKKRSHLKQPFAIRYENSLKSMPLSRNHSKRKRTYVPLHDKF